MPALVYFTDNVLYQCELRDIFVQRKKCSVKYTDRKKYAARVLAISNCESVLTRLELTLQGAINGIGNDWICESLQELNYAQVLKDNLKKPDSSNNEIIYVDKSILLETPTITPSYISCFTLTSINEEEESLDESSRFLILKKTTPNNDNESQALEKRGMTSSVIESSSNESLTSNRVNSCSEIGKIGKKEVDGIDDPIADSPQEKMSPSFNTTKSNNSQSETGNTGQNGINGIEEKISPSLNTTKLNNLHSETGLYRVTSSHSCRYMRFLGMNFSRKSS